MAHRQVGAGERVGVVWRQVAAHRRKGFLGPPLLVLCFECVGLLNRPPWHSQGPFFAAYPILVLISLQHKPSHVRFYRDYSIADFSFCAFFTAVATYGAFLGPARTGVCEELSHHPELMRDVLEMGLNLENCELWLERAVFAGLAFMLVIMVIRVSPHLPCPCIALCITHALREWVLWQVNRA